MKIDFYILDGVSGQKSLYFACQLIEKNHAEQKRVYVSVNSREEGERFDALLWTYRDDSFIPHDLYSTTDDGPPPVQIGFDTIPNHHSQVLLNLSKQIPTFYHQFDQVIEIVFSDPVMQQLARERYKQYRNNGCEINTTTLKANEL